MPMGGGEVLRSDMDSFAKENTLRDYILLKMDGSAIFSAYRRDFLIDNDIKFTKYFHEDVYFMFLVYYYANNIKIIYEKIYKKYNRKNSIVNSISKRHIDGFLHAYEKIYIKIKNKKTYSRDYLIGFIGVIAVKLRDIYKYAKSDKMELYNYLYDRIKSYKIDENTIKDSFKIETKYLKMFNNFMHIMKQNTDNKEQCLDKNLSDILEKSWSCYDLHNSIFLASDEIRICCKRFFVNGEKKGDVVLFKIKENNKDDIFTQILESKQNLYKKINSGDAEECYGCPHLEFKKWAPLSKLTLEKISFEYHSICNMKCIYCSPKYYDGKKPLYDINNVIENLIKNKSLDNAKSIVWGGGEPTIEKSFDLAITQIAQNINFKQMVITNSMKYSCVLQNLLDSNKVNITTSIDCGYENNFKNIRGANGLTKVLDNLHRYAKNNPQNITIKYIIMQNNNSKDELMSFVNLIKKYKLTKCNFHLSCNFNEISINSELVISACILYALLKKINISVVFFDELLRERIVIHSKNDLNIIKESLKKYNLDSYIEDSAKYEKICIWGNNTQTKILLNKSLFLKNIKDICIIDSNDIGEKLLNFTIKNPSDFLESNYPILISAVQGTPRIYHEFLKIGFDEKRLIKGIVL